VLIIGECKDAGGKIDSNDIDNLSRVAGAFSPDRIQVYILLAKLAPFNAEEIALAKTLNKGPYTRRVIMLTERELEPYMLYERTNSQLGLNLYSHSANELADATHKIYFRIPPSEDLPTHDS
jgi:hypothetical protein